MENLTWMNGTTHAFTRAHAYVRSQTRIDTNIHARKLKTGKDAAQFTMHDINDRETMLTTNSSCCYLQICLDAFPIESRA